MNSQQLIVFREVMKTGSVSQAARNLHRTQPAVSASIRTLEVDLGLPLFLREGRRMVPVPEAHYLMQEATEILARLQTARQNLSNMRDRTKGSLRIVAMPGPSSTLLPVFVSRFIDSNEDIAVTLATRSSPQVRSLIAAQSFDIGFSDISGAPEAKDDYNSEAIECLSVCALPAGHPLADRETVDAKDLSGVPMGALQPEHSTFKETQRAFRQAGANFNLRIEAQYFLPLFHFVEKGQICAVVDVLSAASYIQTQSNPPPVVFRPFRPEVPFSYAVLTPHERPLSQLTAEFYRLWCDWVRQTILRFPEPVPMPKRSRSQS
ncbi:transcriptional regulator, LysR family protein [Roseobacter sp. SK209-2-6]|uniref:LysR family transcriptional regulator n=1 Tax=Roseobacter sp. SK209-2-6 TaxID=388739 RepID=UPI0000F3F53B|nr:LysR family transcriptional regulator [Roseobacter sp. SK209-2-6]EBA14726.1 transcriptional regulator, LysR family protein [Roseobacter sp. SK209-2-6]